jgi:large subunit ribosomal protein L7/L12
MEPATQGSGDKGGGVMVATGAEYPDDIREIGDQIANLTLIQAVELSQYLEQVHGIKAAGGVPQYVPEQQQKVEEKAPEKTEFDVILDGYDESKKIGVIKVYRELSGAAIKDAKDFIEGGKGKALKQAVPKAEAEAIKAKFEQAGAKVLIQ